MYQSILESAAWRRALTLAERLAELRPLWAKTQIPIDRELAAETLALWRANSPFDQDQYFSERLAVDGITEEEFTQVLGTSIESLNGDGLPAPWMESLTRAYSSPAEPGEAGHEFWGEISNATTARFLNLLLPLMNDARCRLESRVTELKRSYLHAPIDAKRTVNALFVNLPRQLLVLIEKTMVLELNAARLEGVLAGATPAERFTNFIQRLSRAEIVSEIFSRYPVLARRVVSCIDHWVNFSSEFLQHLAADWAQIVKLFDLDSQNSMLVEAKAGAGDSHRQGRSVIVARFENGSQLVYKPRSMAVDKHFQDFIHWVNEKGANPQLRALKILDCKNHGWAEFMHTGGCATQEEVVRFYERQGEYLAILYILEATDFHFENLLACGEHPVLVDLEALFHPWVYRIDLKQPDIHLVSMTKARSVLRSGLLPGRAWAREDYAGVDLTGLGGGAPGQVSDKVLQWAGVGTDQMAAIMQPLQMAGGRNRPTLNGADVKVQQYTQPIISGFCRMYDLLRSHRDELLSNDGPLERFAQDEVRVVARATRGYGVLLAQSLHPDYMRDALDLERLLDGIWAGIEDNQHLLRLIPAERRDLLQGDIPIFTTRPASKDIFSSSGEKIADFLDKSAMDLSREHVKGLSDADRRQQVWFIAASLGTLDLSAEDFQWPRYQPVWGASFSRNQLRPMLIEEACRIGNRLEDLALQDGPHAAWIGFNYTNKVWSLDALLEELYGGTPGLILPLAYLGSFGFDRYTGLARRALATLRIRLESSGDYLKGIGAFSGWGGIIYMLAHLGTLWNDPELFAYAYTLIDRLPGLIEKDDALDVVGGCAGCIGSLLALHKVSPSEKTLAICIQCGERLLAKAQPMEKGLAWFTNLENDEPITGFAHGSAGIAWALFELAALSGNEKYKTAAIEAIVYESSRYSSVVGNWADHPGRSEVGGKKAVAPSMAWCYGAPGIGMSRAAALKHTDHPMVRLDLERAIQAMLNQGPGTNHSICHGDVGNLDFLLQAAEATGNSELAQKVDELSNQIIASIKKYGWLCGVPLGVESPALMNGLAGICYGLLRLADPDRVPSVLTLSPPSV
jgi:type 2 lantibiotic biosynthesis protein LanM